MVEEKEISKEFEGLIHGISPKRIIDFIINPMMICPMCERIFWNPQTCSTPDCGRTLCEPCLKRTVEERETCKDCLRPTKYYPNTFFGGSFKTLTFKCQNHLKCSEILSYKDLPYHICRHDQMKCPISPECKWTGDREELVEHIPQCPKEIMICKNEGCGHKHQRENQEEHIMKCMFQIIECPKLCGFEGRRGQLDEHLSSQCPLVQLECGYIYRGCEYSPVRRDYEGHMLGCLYQPKVVGCGHEVNLGNEDSHCEVCNEFPVPCDQCGYVFTRGGLLGHRCLVFLGQKIVTQEQKSVTQEHKIETQEHKIETQEHKIETQGQKILTQEHKIETQEHKIETQGQKIVTQEQKIETQNHQIVSLEHKIVSQDNKITVLEHIIEGFKPQIVHIKPKYIYIYIYIGKTNRGTKETTIS